VEKKGGGGGGGRTNHLHPKKYLWKDENEKSK